MFSLSTCTGMFIDFFDTREEAMMYAVMEGLKGEFRIEGIE